MKLTAAVVASVGEALGVPVGRQQPVGGGCISPAARVDLAGGTRLFVKAVPDGAPADMLIEEARSLRRLRAAARAAGNSGASLIVPEVLAEGTGWIALEWLDAVPASPGAWSELGRGLAALHGERRTQAGWETRNYIGPLEQVNEPAADWPAFWRERRLLPQMERARHVLDPALLNLLEGVLEKLDDLLAPGEAEGASLLHGDLWNGNVLMTASGPALVDPASSYGHREVDLAMAALFGGFGAGFERTYCEEWPLTEGAPERRAAYQLYYLLVHVNLFGSTYLGRTREAARTALG